MTGALIVALAYLAGVVLTGAFVFLALPSGLVLVRLRECAKAGLAWPLFWLCVVYELLD